MAQQIKVVAIDVYGTILATDDPDDELPQRKGIEGFIEKYQNAGIKIVAQSTESLTNVKISLEETKKTHKYGIDTSVFKGFYCLRKPKDFSIIVRDLRIRPVELLVIDDSEENIEMAKKYGARYFKVPEYKDKRDDFDLSKEINLGI